MAETIFESRMAEATVTSDAVMAIESSNPIQALPLLPQPQLRSPLILALDVDERDHALRLVDELGEMVGCFKLGPRLVSRYGEDLIREIASRAPVFVDCKLFDIPSTMEAAVRASFAAGATFVTVHALSGREALLRMASLERELAVQRPFKILCVTVLTSWSEDSMPKNFSKHSLQEHVELLAEQVGEAGMTGLVCSPHELESLVEKGFYCVTPGVRIGTTVLGDDQARVMTPDQAIELGAKAFVVGRPIIEAKNPREAAVEYAIAMIGKRS